jgi:hypothetical protein
MKYHIVIKLIFKTPRYLLTQVRLIVSINYLADPPAIRYQLLKKIK